ncbi:hypothetical protein EON82_23650, partial [bacterium]
VRDFENGVDLLTLPGSDDIIVAPFDRRFAVAFSTEGFRVWNLKTKSVIKTVASANAPNVAQLSPDGNLLAIGFVEGTIDLYDTRDWSRVWSSAVHDSFVVGICFDRVGKRLFVAGGDDANTVLDQKTGGIIQRLVGHSQAVLSIDASPDGRRLATTSLDLTLKIWDAATGRELTTLDTGGTLYTSARFSEDGRSIYGVSKFGKLRVWSVGGRP